jgi:hypothetical protein
MNQILLIMTAGRTDVQLVQDGVRREIDKSVCRAYHAWLEQHSDWTIVDSPLKQPGAVQELPAPGMFVATPKLDAVLDYILQNPAWCLCHALLLYTRRDEGDEEPFYAAEVSKKRLTQRMGSVPVTLEVYLRGNERLNDLSDPREAVLAHRIAARAEEAILNAARTTSPNVIVVASAGGIPGVADLVEEVSRLHSPPGAEHHILEVTDGSRGRPPGPDVAVPRERVPAPAASFRLRRISLSLIERGDLLGAWGVASEHHPDEQERRWTRVIDWLRCFAASLPMDPACDIPLLQSNMRAAAQAGVRVEMALRLGDIPRAVHGTVSFFEAALHDHLGQRLEFLPGIPRQVRVRTPADHPSPVLTQRQRSGKRAFINIDSTTYKIWDGGDCAVALARDYVRAAELTKFAEIVTVPPVSELRNDVAHGVPTQERMNEAEHVMQDKGLWSADRRFLSQPLVQEVLSELGVPEPGHLCVELLKDVRGRLTAPLFRDAT